MKCIAMGKYAPAVINGVLADPQARVKTMKSLIEGVGGNWVDGFFVRGPYDFAFLCDVPNEEALSAVHAIVYSSGAVDDVSIHTELDIAKVAAAAARASKAYTPPR
ncbi:MAG: GYD domain-containing protein [Pseudomonadota bacterium]